MLRHQERAIRRRYGHTKYRRPAGSRDPIWYRWSVLYRDTPGGKIQREIVDAVSHDSAISAVHVYHSGAVDFAAMKLGKTP